MAATTTTTTTSVPVSKNTNLDKLYENYYKLEQAKDDIQKFEPAFLAILGSVHGSPQEKQLCSQFISKFFNHFPAHYATAIDALIDLCEDEDPNIRRRAIKELPNICRERKEFIPKIADILAQLLVSEDQIELNIVNQALITLANFDLKSFLVALFSQILDGEEDTRDRVIKFLSSKLKSINQDLLTKEVEEFFLQECKKVLIDVTKDEFIALMNLLSGLKISKTLNGHNTLLSIIKDQAELNNDFIPSDAEFLDKFLMCVRHGIPYFSQFSPSTDFVLYICTKILPNLSRLQDGMELEVLQALAETVPFISPNLEAEKIDQCQDVVFNLLLEYVPKPPEDLNASSDLSNDLPSTQFSHVECLLYSLHQLCKFNPKYFDNKAEEFKDFKIRLQYLARVVQNYVTKLRKAIAGLKPEELKSPENMIKMVALKATSNISALTRDFFKIPPSYKTNIQLSFKQPAKGGTAASTLKLDSTAKGIEVTTPKPTDQTTTEPGVTPIRKRPLITAPEGSESVKRDRKFYTPPVGRFSRGGSAFPRHSYSAGAGGGGFNFRGRNQRGRGGRGGFPRRGSFQFRRF